MFIALLFGFKTAPLTWSRVAALVARLVQILVPREEGRRQVYLDDSLWALAGSLKRRTMLLSCILTTMASLGLKVNLEKGERSMQVTWVGVEFKLQPPHFGASHQLAREVPYRAPGPAEGLGSKGNDRHERTTKGSGKSFMVGWSAGCARWTTPILYGALFDQEDGVEKGIEEARRQQREDSRDKSRLIPLKRIEHARSWLVEYLAAALASLKPNQASAKILITLRTGAILVVNGRVTKALASPVTAAEDSKLLNFELGSSASQGIVETLVILVALRHWEKLLLNVGATITVQSDSVTALSIAQKFANSSRALNFLGRR